MSNYDYDCWGGPDGRCGVHKVPYVYLDGVPESGRECAASWVMRALAAEAALDQVRDALHTAYSIIANAQNCLGDGDPTLGPQWYEAAQRFMQDYNANLDVNTGPISECCEDGTSRQAGVDMSDFDLTSRMMWDAAQREADKSTGSSDEKFVRLLWMAQILAAIETAEAMVAR